MVSGVAAAAAVAALVKGWWGTPAAAAEAHDAQVEAWAKLQEWAARPGGRGMKRRFSEEAAHYVTCALADALQGGAMRDGLDEHVLDVRSFQLEDIPSAPLPIRHSRQYQ